MTEQKKPGRGRVYGSITETIGDTPIVRLDKLAKEKGVKAHLLAKLEFFNPLASVKDRIGLAMILDLEKSGRLKPGGTLLAIASAALARPGRVADAEALKQTGKGLHAGLIGSLRVGLSSGPGALLSLPLMLHMAEHHPKLQLQISRGNTAVLIDALREQLLDAAVVDVRSVRPSADLQVAQAFELPAGFLVRPDHPLTQLGRPVTLDE